jgi:hypothetical protein
MRSLPVSVVNVVARTFVQPTYDREDVYGATGPTL